MMMMNASHCCGGTHKRKRPRTTLRELGQESSSSSPLRRAVVTSSLSSSSLPLSPSSSLSPCPPIQQSKHRHGRSCRLGSSFHSYATTTTTTTTTTTCSLVGILLVLLFLLASPTTVVLVHGERAYPLGCSSQPTSYYDYDNYPFPPPHVPLQSPQDYWLVRRLGAGKFSDVFEALMEEEKEEEDSGSPSSPSSPISSGHQPPKSPKKTVAVVLKCLKPVSDRKIKRELLVLSHCADLPNLARLRGVVVPPSWRRNPTGSPTTTTTGGTSTSATTTTTTSATAATTTPPTTTTKLQPMPSLVLEHAGISCQWLCHGKPQSQDNPIKKKEQQEQDPYLSELEIKYFLYHLLVALNSLHSRGIMHRDVKPRNVLINRHTCTSYARQSHTKKKKNHDPNNEDMPLMLIDLGLADFYVPHTPFNVRVASRHYKSPELLVGYEYYDYAIDMWGVGCILVGLLLRREPFFRGKDNTDQLRKIIHVLGTTDLRTYLTKYNIHPSRDVRKILSQQTRKGHTHRQQWLSLLFMKQTQQQPSQSHEPKCPIPSQEGLDLLDKLLVYDHDQRLTAQQAMEHSFFDAVRDRVTAEIQHYPVVSPS